MHPWGKPYLSAAAARGESEAGFDVPCMLRMPAKQRLAGTPSRSL
jgi:hypothetical protein